MFIPPFFNLSFLLRFIRIRFCKHFNMNFIKNIHAGERAIAVAVLRHNGKRTMVVDVDTTTENGELMTRATATMFVRDLYDNIPESW